MKKYLVTGGAGFIGSNVAAGLAKTRPQDHVTICDFYGTNDDKWRNNVRQPVDEYISPAEMFYWLDSNAESLDAIIHMGAISSTTETDGDLMLETNFTLPRILWAWCRENGKRFIYASSASVYGGGEHGFDDDISLEAMNKLRPLNTYGWSKYIFDYHIARALARGEETPAQWAGLRFFNVYGPNEYHKSEQQSVISRIFPRAKEGLAVNLFKSYHPDYKDGEQLRDFVYVKDCVNVVLWLIDNPDTSGMFNVGSGKAQSFNDLAAATFVGAGKETNINFIDMPEELKNKYQYFTESNNGRLEAAGYTKSFQPLEEGVKDYVQNYLMLPDPHL